ncbi:helix-turn-helix domain-containing protein [Emticicia sp. 17c]|uniref:helix-turn-helix domain-containing protein n=1 Tax=Emticicia sp. 17c TaxID=3127704 RepID=UPI00301D2737
MKTLVNFKGLYGDTQSMELPYFIHHEPLETRSRMHNWEIKEHLHTELFQVFIIEQGAGTIISDGHSLQLSSPCVMCIPANTLHGFAFQPETKGEVITFSEAFFESLFKNMPKLLLEINRFQLLAFKNEPEHFTPILHYAQELTRELYETNPEKQTVIQSLLQLFFVYLYRFSLSQQATFSNASNRTLHYFQEFQKSIRRSLHETRTISQYARELHITSVHLNRICQALVQKSALQIVQEHLINEAKKYLLNTNYAVSEIAYFLNIKDPAYFTRLFKKLTGVTPSDFRKN